MKVNNSETSLLAYANNADNFINREDQALEVLESVGPMTSNELFEHIKDTFPENYRHNTHARLSGLRDRGLVFESGKTTCKITGETVIVWSPVPSGQELSYRKIALDKKLTNARKLVQKLEKQITELTQCAG